MTELFKELAETHSDRHRRKFLLLFECIDDGVDRVIEQTRGFLTSRYEVRRSAVVAWVERNPTLTTSTSQM